MGADAVVDVRRKGGPFDFTDVDNPVRFINGYYRANEKTHLTDQGSTLIAKYIMTELRRIKL